MYARHFIFFPLRRRRRRKRAKIERPTFIVGRVCHAGTERLKSW